MPGFRIQDIGSNFMSANPDSRYYTSYTWELLSLFTPSDSSGSQAYYNLSNSPILNLRTCTLPQVTFERIAAEGGTVKYKFAGKPTFEDIRLSWYDSFGLAPRFKEWVESVYTRTDGVKVPSSYKKNSTIRKYLPDRPDSNSGNQQNSNNPPEAVEYQLFGSWPLAYKESELTYLEASIKSIELTVSYDDYEINITEGRR